MAGARVGLMAGVPLGLALLFTLVKLEHLAVEAHWAPVPVLVAAKDVPAGTALTDADLVEATFLEPLVTPSCATPETRARFVGQPVRWKLLAGVVVRDSDLVRPDPACAARVTAVAATLDGGLSPELSPLVDALVSRHGGGAQ